MASRCEALLHQEVWHRGPRTRFDLSEQSMTANRSPVGVAEAGVRRHWSSQKRRVQWERERNLWM